MTAGIVLAVTTASTSTSATQASTPTTKRATATERATAATKQATAKTKVAPREAPSTTVFDPTSEIDPNELIECLGGPAALTQGLGQRRAAPKNLREQIDSIATWVEKERGLRFKKRPQPTFMAPAQLKARAKALVEQDYPAREAALDAGLLAAFGVVGPKTDMQQLRIDLLGDQVAGYYDPDSKELVVVTSDRSKVLDAEKQITLAHELEHALADQALGLPDLEAFSDRDADAALAAQALIEGGATLTMYRYLVSQIPLDQMLSLMDSPTIGESTSDLAKYPPYIQRSLMWPYTEGLRFACRLYQDGGWKSIDAAYKKLPKSTAEIRDPELYLRAVRPTDPADPGSLSSPWKLDRKLGIGESELVSLFGDTRATLQLKGGEVFQYTDGPRTAIGISLDGPVCEQTARWYDSAFATDRSARGTADERLVVTGAPQSAVLRCTGSNVRLGLAPDLQTARALVK